MIDFLYDISVWWLTEVTWNYWFAIIVYVTQLYLCIYGNKLTKRIPLYFWCANAILWLITFPLLFKKFLYPFSALQLYYVLVIFVARGTHLILSKIIKKIKIRSQNSQET